MTSRRGAKNGSLSYVILSFFTQIMLTSSVGHVLKKKGPKMVPCGTPIKSLTRNNVLWQMKFSRTRFQSVQYAKVLSSQVSYRYSCLVVASKVKTNYFLPQSFIWIFSVFIGSMSNRVLCDQITCVDWQSASGQPTVEWWLANSSLDTWWLVIINMITASLSQTIVNRQNWGDLLKLKLSSKEWTVFEEFVFG